MDVSETLDNSSPIDHEPDDLLADDGELSTTAEIEDPIHLAKCAECATAVRFRSNITGTGFFLVDEAPDTSFGIGEHGRPTCPNGHGEMAIADEHLKPATEAFKEAQEQLDAAEPRKPRLPFPVPMFNHANALHAAQEKRRSIVALETKVRDRKDSLKRAVDELADANVQLGKLLDLAARDEQDRLDEQERRENQAAAGGPAPVPCAWEAKHPVGEPCPICSGKASAVILQYLGDPGALAPADAQVHVDDVDRLLLALEVDEVLQALEAIDTYITADVVVTWAEADRKAVTLWADATLDKETNDDIVVPDRPEVLGEPHIPAKAVNGEHQVCSRGEVVIHAASDEERDPYEVTDSVGTDCAGQPGKVGHHYPKSSKKKPAAKTAKKKASK